MSASVPSGEAPVPYNESSMSLYPMSQVSIDSSTPVDLGIFDWNTISGPSMKTALLMPLVHYVPATGLSPALNPEVPITPNIGQHATANSNLSYSLGDLESPSLPLQDIDWSSITELICQSSPATVQSSFQSSPLAPSVSIPSTPGDVTDLPTPPSLTYDGSKPTSTLDSSVPPSVFLPVQPEAFAGGEHDLWSLLCGELS
ncbi:hypothetical protein B0F90DRAFT_1813471 [Multifurca ochricompacta]|uniref:Uncharacterized protein n=1 Tax=Multifurca ochricompacta TaxID=376703 RepID=A0AAD4QUE0_9AGAM|nr:hypothetical protein B0F90DRAFT_1813471 [Multifurca ochricompacta]